jgi:hypothetical protein
MTAALPPQQQQIYQIQQQQRQMIPSTMSQMSPQANVPQMIYKQDSQLYVDPLGSPMSPSLTPTQTSMSPNRAVNQTSSLQERQPDQCASPSCGVCGVKKEGSPENSDTEVRHPSMMNMIQHQTTVMTATTTKSIMY